MEWRVDARGRLRGEAADYLCVLGRGGRRADKREGDGATPVGRFMLRTVFFRPDRGAPPLTRLPWRAIEPDLGWCDDPDHPDYNRLIHRPHPARHEPLWREDGLYDLLVVLGHNDAPVVPGAGSAIFLHVAPPDGSLTAGCVALAPDDLRDWLARCGPGDALVVEP